MPAPGRRNPRGASDLETICNEGVTPIVKVEQLRGFVAEPARTYGGPWTVEKLEILEAYLNAYTTALKNQPFRLMYIDAFAGTGSVNLPEQDPEVRDFHHGSAARALAVQDKPFDRLVFVERDPARCQELARLQSVPLGRDIQIVNTEANQYLRSLQEDWRGWRGVLFLDPFATQVELSTLKKIAALHALDTWILFPVSAIARMLPKSKRPADISDQWAQRLTRVFGDEEWSELYREAPQGNLFGTVEHERDPGVAGLLGIYKTKLAGLFGKRFLKQSRSLKNSRNSTLFEFLFCVGHPSGIATAKRIARHILEHL